MSLPLNQVIRGDALEVLRSLPSNSLDALVTDPPAAISFMGKSWDDDKGGAINWINWLAEIMSEALRVLKPGACGVVWSIPRTCGYTQLALELAGFRVVDSIAILNGEGFPKGADVSRHIDKLHGCDREVVGKRIRTYADNPNSGGNTFSGSTHTSKSYNGGLKLELGEITAPAHPEAKKWDGWKSAQLKPAHETWFLVQKPPCEGSIARNVLKWGVGGINIEACRIGTEPTLRPNGKTAIWNEGGGMDSAIGGSTSGRYPANTILICSPECNAEAHADHCPVATLGEQARYFKQLPHDAESFRYFTKASKRDRTCGGAVPNAHPTVKNRELMRYFCKLLTPPGGTVLDPFGGSGSTAIGAILENFNYLLIEQDPEYYEIALARIAAVNAERLAASVQLSIGAAS